MASPVKNMKTGKYSHNFQGGVGGYTPYKMLGHELPGIKQRGMPYSIGDPLNEDMVDAVSTSPDLAPPTKFLGIFGKAAKRAGKSIKDVFKKDEPVEPETATVTPHGDEAHTGGAEPVARVAQPTASAGLGPGNLFGGTPTGGLRGAPSAVQGAFDEEGKLRQELNQEQRMPYGV